MTTREKDVKILVGAIYVNEQVREAAMRGCSALLTLDKIEKYIRGYDKSCKGFFELDPIKQIISGDGAK